MNENVIQKVDKKVKRTKKLAPKINEAFGKIGDLAVKAMAHAETFANDNNSKNFRRASREAAAAICELNRKITRWLKKL